MKAGKSVKIQEVAMLLKLDTSIYICRDCFYCKLEIFY